MAPLLTERGEREEQENRESFHHSLIRNLGCERRACACYNPDSTMPTEVEQLRDLARAFWAGKEILCPKHPGVKMTGSFVQTTFADHIFLTCPRGNETIAIPQRPKQIPFQAQQVEGFVENIQRGDA